MEGSSQKIHKLKTNAVRTLERAGIPFELREYPFDVEHFSAERVAEQIGMEPEMVFKTLFVCGDRSGYFFALLPANTELDLRSLAHASGNKKVDLVPLRDVQELTGYMRGAVTVLGAKKTYPVYIDESAMLWERIAISAGARGLQIILAPADLIRLAGGVMADITLWGK